MKVVFKKSGREIQAAIENRISGLQSRLNKRNQSLDALLDDRTKLRSYLVRSSTRNYGHGGGGEYALVSKDDISSEEKEEIDQLLRRINEIEQEIRRLKLIAHHLSPKDNFELNYNELISYGFEAPGV